MNMEQNIPIQELIDGVWKAECPAIEAAEDIIQGCGMFEYRQIFIVFLMAFEKISLEVKIQDNQQSLIYLRANGIWSSAEVVKGVHPGAILHLSDVGYSLVPQCATVKTLWGPLIADRASRILATLQYVRDRFDGVIYLPSGQRDHRISADLSGLGIDREFLGAIRRAIPRVEKITGPL